MESGSGCALLVYMSVCLCMHVYVISVVKAMTAISKFVPLLKPVGLVCCFCLSHSRSASPKAYPWTARSHHPERASTQRCLPLIPSTPRWCKDSRHLYTDLKCQTIGSQSGAKRIQKICDSPVLSEKECRRAFKPRLLGKNKASEGSHSGA